MRQTGKLGPKEPNNQGEAQSRPFGVLVQDQMLTSAFFDNLTAAVLHILSLIHI